MAASTAASPAGRSRDLGFISPVVAKIASEQGVDLFQVKGTGQGGRITKKDILAYIEGRASVGTASVGTATTGAAMAPMPATIAPAVQVAAPPAPEKGGVPGEIVPLNAVRARHRRAYGAEQAHLAARHDGHGGRSEPCRGSPPANKEAFARDGANLTFTAYFVAAAAAALRAYPIVNSSFTEQGILLRREINIGVATSLGEAGLIVPVIKGADGLSLLGLARLINDLANRARARQLKPDEVQGGTFTITNHGVSGSLFATPIINQPAVRHPGGGRHPEAGRGGQRRGAGRQPGYPPDGLPDADL